MEKNDYKYFNVVMVNRTDSDIPATFHERRVQPTLDEMSDYEIGNKMENFRSFFSSFYLGGR